MQYTEEQNREYSRNLRKMDEIEMNRDVLKNQRKRRRRYSYRYLKKVTISCSLIASLLTSTATGLIVHRVQKEKFLENKIGDYKELIMDTVDENHTTGARDDYNYAKIAQTILDSDNPDLALFTLYKYYGTQKHVPYFNRITNRTFNEIDDSEKNYDEKTHDAIGFYNYVKENGYKNDKKYYKDCVKELINDDDSNLDNLKVSIKKYRRR